MTKFILLIFFGQLIVIGCGPEDAKKSVDKTVTGDPEEDCLPDICHLAIYFQLSTYAPISLVDS